MTEFKNTIRRYLPTLGQAHMLVREFTLIFTVLFTIMSLAIFWGEMAATSDIPPEGLRVIEWMINGITAGLMAWITLWVARMTRNARRSGHNVQ